MIVIPWNKSVESYVDLGPDVGRERPTCCPDCDCSELIFWGKRSRFVTGSAGSSVLFVRRVRCKGCGKTHTVLPSFLLKNQAYLVELIVLALIMVLVEGKGSRAASEKLGIARSTIRRWISRFKQSAAGHYRRFLFLKHNLCPKSPSPPAASYPKAVLDLFSELFGLKSGESKAFSRWVSLATGGRLLFDQPAMAP